MGGCNEIEWRKKLRVEIKVYIYEYMKSKFFIENDIFVFFGFVLGVYGV